eukprot:scaffold198797_cov19-Tisochrysis_lutea.AAC.1
MQLLRDCGSARADNVNGEHTSVPVCLTSSPGCDCVKLNEQGKRKKSRNGRADNSKQVQHTWTTQCLEVCMQQFHSKTPCTK